MSTIAGSLSSARAAGLDRLDADLLLLHALGTAAAELNQRRSWLLAHDADPVEVAVQVRYEELVRRRSGGEPLAYIVGHKEFFGLNLAVDARVLVPRPDTEILVEWALALIDTLPGRKTTAPLRLLDLGTGSGAIALALKHARPLARIDAVDASVAALALARANAARLGLELHWLHSSWFDAVTGQYHAIVSNPPYIRDADPHLPELAHEPAMALTSGPDGLRDIRQIVAGAGRHLAPGGWLLLEHGYDQARTVRELLQTAGFRHVESRRDLGGHWRCTAGQWRLDPG
ncbi:MAG: peptide chain release factor N(5)-glutamine methyltransferase [Burkholderiaceae bacterium]